MPSRRLYHVAASLILLAAPGLVAGQGRPDELSRYFATQVDREELVRIPMRDGKRLNASLFFPKARARQDLPTILTFFPYQINPVSAENRAFLENGYALAYVNVRGRYFSEGTYTYLGGSGPDSYDTINWLSRQPWSNGKVGALGCSSSAEEQHRMNAMGHPAFAAAVPRASGAGIGRMGPYNEMGNHYRGGVFQNLWYSWYHGSGYKFKPSFPEELTRDQMLRLARNWNTEPQTIARVNFDSVIATLPIGDIPRRIGSAPSDLDDFMTWPMNDPRWKTIEFGNEGDRNHAPALYINSWYDVSTGPNMAMFEYQSRNAASPQARDNTFMIIAPTGHCQMGRVETEHTVVGERDMGDARFDYTAFMVKWYDRWLKGIDNGVEREPRVRVYNMGANQWRTYSKWPPREATPMTYYLDSDGTANTSKGNGRLVLKAPKAMVRDTFTYDPLKPTPSAGGQVCCFNAAQAGAFDQSAMQSRADVLVYTSDVLTAPVDVTGPVQVTLYVSSDVKDTDLMVRLVDVQPDGKAWNLDEQALRLRWREGWDAPVMMEAGKVYQVKLPPLVTSNTFKAGHRIRVSIASSSFPVYERNLNTGGPNYNEKDPVVAHTSIHHGPQQPSSITLTVVPAKR
ncbi:MAG: CocE/NonD family hydrolase [Gemmatimonadetes bacterium]|nr:CocE/NonD family hydrolase [Gemmatimonadota bacterium]